MNTEIKLDVRNLDVSRQISRTKNLLLKLYPGQTLMVSADSSSIECFKNYFEETKNRLIKSTQKGNAFYYRIEKYRN